MSFNESIPGAWVARNGTAKVPAATVATATATTNADVAVVVFVIVVVVVAAAAAPLDDETRLDEEPLYGGPHLVASVMTSEKIHHETHRNTPRVSTIGQ